MWIFLLFYCFSALAKLKNVYIQWIFLFREFYEYTSSHKYKLLLVQCESANDNIELLDSVRYIMQREGKDAKKNGRYMLTHTVLLLNLPRGHAFNGYQGRY